MCTEKYNVVLLGVAGLHYKVELQFDRFMLLQTLCDLTGW